MLLIEFAKFMAQMIIALALLRLLQLHLPTNSTAAQSLAVLLH